MGPLVSVIIPNMDLADDLKRCIESLYDINIYKNFEIINEDVLKIDLNKELNYIEDIINKYMGFRTPFKGAFYGNGTISGKIKNLKALLIIQILNL